MSIQPICNIHNEDCIAGMRDRLADESVDLTVTSIPFEELFTYSGKAEDVGNNGSTVDVRSGRFIINLRFVIAELYRVHRPGSVCCIHIQQLLAYKNQHGFMGRRDFRGAVIDAFRAHGWMYTGEAAIPKDPQAMAQRLNLHSLQFKTGYARDAAAWAPAVNDFLLQFRKPGERPVPIRPLIHRDNPRGWITQDQWIEWARGVWEIDEFDVLDGYRYTRESDQEKHVCPLQLELIRRCILLWSNPIDIQPDSLVLDPFMGIGSTAFEAIRHNRSAVGFELKESYHAAAMNNVEKARRLGSEPQQSSMFADTEAA